MIAGGRCREAIGCQESTTCLLPARGGVDGCLELASQVPRGPVGVSERRRCRDQVRDLVDADQVPAAVLAG
jgi:hypothetical protein